MLMLLLSIERDRCMSLPEGDERADALGDLTDAAPHLIDRLKASIAEFSKIKEGKGSSYSEIEKRFIHRILSAVNGDPAFMETARVVEVSGGSRDGSRYGTIDLHLIGDTSTDHMRYDRNRREFHRGLESYSSLSNLSSVGIPYGFPRELTNPLLETQIRTSNRSAFTGNNPLLDSVAVAAQSLSRGEES